LRAILIGQLGLFLVIALAWEATLRLGAADPSMLPPIPQVFGILSEFLQDRDFLRHLGITALEVIVAFAISVPVAVTTGFMLGERLRLAKAVYPYIYLVMAVPQSVFLPVFILAFGTGFLEKVLFGITHAFFVIVINTFAAVRSVPAAFVLAARAFGATPKQIYLRIYLPAMLPLVLTGLRLGLIFCIIGVLLTEMYASRTGIGRLIFGWGEAYKVPELMAAVLLISVFTVVLNEGLRLVEMRAGRRYGSAVRIKA
jgi:NitT/TauT family transport system permease protein